ncbi:hypothetical protein FA95DRAFT_990969 [Auriscalpium vulgare]|uniref:Uncharacterized protein n=1 Tax=Auriscalpium vulgare TaxID=40419 RepID=A0ACB8R829_9AGAM|nr:hypothetical protein FA95DRAFT_990969 [Auriscalpium vulgare]
MAANSAAPQPAAVEPWTWPVDRLEEQHLTATLAQVTRHQSDEIRSSFVWNLSIPCCILQPPSIFDDQLVRRVRDDLHVRTLHSLYHALQCLPRCADVTEQDMHTHLAEVSASAHESQAPRLRAHPLAYSGTERAPPAPRRSAPAADPVLAGARRRCLRNTPRAVSSPCTYRTPHGPWSGCA